VNATTVMAIAVVGGLVGRWAHNQKTIPSAGGVVEVAFAVVVIAALDQGRTQPIARGLAWLFLAAVLLSSNSPLTGIAKAVNAKPKPKPAPKKGK
jgi:uncharacterized MAPEG superfamily protein